MGDLQPATPSLPPIPLEPKSQERLWRVLRVEYPDLKAREMAALPQDRFLRKIDLRLSTLNQTVTLDECKECLRFLALAGLPRANIEESDTDAIFGLYWSLFIEKSITYPMLFAASKNYVMDNRKPFDKKWYPDPGQLAALCADDLADAARKRRVLTKAKQDLLELNGQMAKAEETAVPRGKPRSVAEILAAHPTPTYTPGTE